jgi:hypothetical protein
MQRIYIDPKSGHITVRSCKRSKPDGKTSPQAMRKAKTLAALHGVTIERERPRAFWVTCAALSKPAEDPRSGNHFCTNGHEVLEAVQTYVDHLTTKKDTP